MSVQLSVKLIRIMGNYPYLVNTKMKIEDYTN